MVEDRTGAGSSSNTAAAPMDAAESNDKTIDTDDLMRLPLDRDLMQPRS